MARTDRNPAAAANRENARQADGKFGEQPHPEAGTDGQLGLETDTIEVGRYSISMQGFLAEEVEDRSTGERRVRLVRDEAPHQVVADITDIWNDTTGKPPTWDGGPVFHDVSFGAVEQGSHAAMLQRHLSDKGALGKVQRLKADGTPQYWAYDAGKVSHPLTEEEFEACSLPDMRNDNDRANDALVLARIELRQARDADWMAGKLTVGSDRTDAAWAGVDAAETELKRLIAERDAAWDRYASAKRQRIAERIKQTKDARKTGRR